MRQLAILLALGACSYDASEDAIWRGTVQRDGGPPLAFAGFDPYPAQGYAFGGGIAAMGYLDDDGGKFLASVRLHFTDRRDFENAMSTSFPITLAITDSSQTPGMHIDFFEQEAATAGDAQQPRTFSHDYAQYQVGTSSGTFTVTRTDYSTSMDGRLQATVTDPSRGNATRTLDLEVQYRGNK